MAQQELTAKEVAEYLGISERTVRRHIKAGLISGRKVAPNRYAILRESLPAPTPQPSMSARLASALQRIEVLERENRELRAASLERPAYVPPPINVPHVIERSAPPLSLRPALPHVEATSLPGAPGQTVNTGLIVCGVSIYTYNGAISKGTAAKLAGRHGANEKSAEKKWPWTDHDRRTVASTLRYARDRTEPYYPGVWHMCDSPTCPVLHLEEDNMETHLAFAD